MIEPEDFRTLPLAEAVRSALETTEYWLFWLYTGVVCSRLWDAGRKEEANTLWEIGHNQTDTGEAVMQAARKLLESL